MARKEKVKTFQLFAHCCGVYENIILNRDPSETHPGPIGDRHVVSETQGRPTCLIGD